jgi:hypothetical protein
MLIDAEERLAQGPCAVAFSQWSWTAGSSAAWMSMSVGRGTGTLPTNPRELAKGRAGQAKDRETGS